MKAEEKERVAIIRTPKRHVVCRVEAWKYHEIVDVLRQAGANRSEAYAIAEWTGRVAKPGKSMSTLAGYTVEIEGAA